MPTDRLRAATDYVRDILYVVGMFLLFAPVFVGVWIWHHLSDESI